MHTKTIEETLENLSTSQEGLSSSEALKRLEESGKNELVGSKPKTIYKIFFEQFKSFLLIILIVAGVISMLFEEYLEGGVIIFIVILNCVLGSYQESKASNALSALKKMASPKAKVIRDEQTALIDASEVVVGDVLVLEAGDSVGADVRLISTANLMVDEAALTGEAEPDSKDDLATLEESTPIGDKVNCAFMNTVVTYGRGVGVVYATGMNTQMGQIATLLSETENEATPLQKSLDDLGKKLGIICIIVCLIIFGIGLIRDMEVLELFMSAVSLAVAAIPEGLTIVVTVILAMGMQRMVKSNAIIKTLGAVETLGSTSVICSDKTGTLTQNKMTVVNVYNNDSDYVVEELTSTESVDKLIEGMCLCSDASVEDGVVIGDPTEGALVELGRRFDLKKDELNSKYKRIDEIPFDSDRKLMSTLHKCENSKVMYTKGAFDEVLKKTKYILINNEVKEITKSDIEKITKKNMEYATLALRVLALAYKEVENDFEEENLIFVGMVGMIDPPREEAKNAISLCKSASINVKMITGDHIVTGCAIAKQLGIIENEGQAIEGCDIENISEAELQEVVKTKNVFARVSPEHKVRIVSAIRKNDNIVAMTGDGVNDAPSLKQADIGVAMGITGTDVSKEAADMILTDDNFASIVKAVEEGRTIYKNIRKVVAYLLSCNVGEILIVFAAMVIGLPMPLGAIQLISVNLITDTFPAFALGVEKAEPGIMSEKPRDAAEPLVNRIMIKMIAVQSIALAVGALLSFIVTYYYFEPALASTACFTTLVFGELLRAYSARFEDVSIFKMKVFENSYLNKTVLFSLIFLIASVYVPGFNTIFEMEALPFINVVIALAFSIVPFIGGEVAKKLS